MLYDYGVQQRKKQELDALRRQEAQKNLRNAAAGKEKGKVGQAKQSFKDAQNLVATATPWGLFSLMREMSFGDWMYFLALFAAILKDIIDLIEVAGFTYILVMVITLCISIFIAMMMLLGSALTGSSSGGYSMSQHRMVRSWLVLLGGTTIEMIFGLDLLPIETLTVIIVYLLALSARKAARES